MGENICRLCLRREGEFYDLFAPPEKGKTNVAEQLGVILNFEIVNNARLPSAICSNCFKILAFITEFRLSCSRVNNYLNELLSISPEINGNGSCDQVSPAVTFEPMYWDITEEKAQPLKPSICDFPGCTKDSKHCKKLKLESPKENVMKSSCDSSHISVINDGRSFNQTHSPPIEGISLSSIPWDKTERDSEADQNCDYDSGCLKSQAKNALIPSFISGEVEEVNGGSMGNYLSDGNELRGCKEVSEFFSWEDEDTIELKIPFESQQITTTPTNTNVPKVIKSEVSGVDLWNSGEKKSAELKVKDEDVIFAVTAFGDEDLDEAPTSDSNVSRGEDSSSPNDQEEKSPVEIISIDVDINKAIYVKLLEIQDSGVQITTKTMKDTSLKVAAEYGMRHFTASDGWLHSFIRRYEICQRIDEVKLPAYSMGITLTNGYITRYCCKELNETLHKLCCELAESGVQLNGYLIKDYARRIAVNEGLYEFSASASWFKSFKKYYKL